MSNRKHLYKNKIEHINIYANKRQVQNVLNLAKIFCRSSKLASAKPGKNKNKSTY